jgi:hypothetical protein
MINTKRFLIGAGVLAVLGACDNSTLTELNKNPNNPEQVPAGPLFTFATQNAVRRYLGGGYDLRQTSFVVQHQAEVQYPDEDRYIRLDPGSTAGAFDGAYTAELEDLTKVIAKGQAANDPGTWAPAEIMRAWVYHYITNTFGDVPYSAANKGDSVGGSLNPAYDTQQAIYNDLFTRLTAASTALSAASNSLGGADPVFGGDPAAWQKFANSLHARMALTLLNVDAAKAATELTAAINAPGGIITDNADNATIAWPGDGLYNNPWADNFRGRDDNRVSKTLIDILAARSDPRVAVYAQPADRDTVATASISKYCTGAPPCYVGLQNGMTQATAGPYVPYTSRPGAAFYPGVTAYGFFGGTGASFPSFLFTAAEGNLILAEASQRGLAGLTAATAPTYYNAGITASMQQWDITDAPTITTYLAGGNVAYVPASGLTQIAVQKWIALYTDGGTAWTEWRRTCQPSTIAPGPAAILATVPHRFGYSPTEYQVNRVNVDAAVNSSLGGDDGLTSHVWWDTLNSCG